MKNKTKLMILNIVNILYFIGTYLLLTILDYSKVELFKLYFNSNPVFKFVQSNSVYILFVLALLILIYNIICARKIKAKKSTKFWYIVIGSMNLLISIAIMFYYKKNMGLPSRFTVSRTLDLIAMVYIPFVASIYLLTNPLMKKYDYVSEGLVNLQEQYHEELTKISYEQLKKKQTEFKKKLNKEYDNQNKVTKDQRIIGYLKMLVLVAIIAITIVNYFLIIQRKMDNQSTAIFNANLVTYILVGIFLILSSIKALPKGKKENIKLLTTDKIFYCLIIICFLPIFIYPFKAYKFLNAGTKQLNVLYDSIAQNVEDGPTDLILAKQGDKFGFINLDGQEVTGFIYSCAIPYYRIENGESVINVAFVCENGKYKFIDLNQNEYVLPSYLQTITKDFVKNKRSIGTTQLRDKEEESLQEMLTEFFDGLQYSQMAYVSYEEDMQAEQPKADKVSDGVFVYNCDNYTLQIQAINTKTCYLKVKKAGQTTFSKEYPVNIQTDDIQEDIILNINADNSITYTYNNEKNKVIIDELGNVFSFGENSEYIGSIGEKYLIRVFSDDKRSSTCYIVDNNMNKLYNAATISLVGDKFIVTKDGKQKIINADFEDVSLQYDEISA